MPLDVLRTIRGHLLGDGVLFAFCCMVLLDALGVRFNSTDKDLCHLWHVLRWSESVLCCGCFAHAMEGGWSYRVGLRGKYGGSGGIAGLHPHDDGVCL